MVQVQCLQYYMEELCKVSDFRSMSISTTVNAGIRVSIEIMNTAVIRRVQNKIIHFLST